MHSKGARTFIANHMEKSLYENLGYKIVSTENIQAYPKKKSIDFYMIDISYKHTGLMMVVSLESSSAPALENLQVLLGPNTLPFLL